MTLSAVVVMPHLLMFKSLANNSLERFPQMLKIAIFNLSVVCGFKVFDEGIFICHHKVTVVHALISRCPQ